jgi:peptide deformylase
LIVQHPNEILSTECVDVEPVKGSALPWDADTIEVTNEMLKQLNLSGGVGLAAPQIGSNKRIIVVDQFAGSEKSNPRVMINPRITKFSNKIEPAIEACLSLPGRKFVVHRAKSIWLTFTDSSGVEQKSFMNGYEARIVQHEIDHLNGKTIAQSGREIV